MPLQVGEAVPLLVTRPWRVRRLSGDEGADPVSLLITEMIDQQTAFADESFHKKYFLVLLQNTFQGRDVGVAIDHQGIGCARR